MESIYTIEIAGLSAIIALLDANSANYLHLSIEVHYKSVRNYKILSVNYHFNLNY